MLGVYLTCLLVGGVFVGLSVFSGLDKELDADLDHEVGLDSDLDVDGHLELDADAADIAHPSIADASHGLQEQGSQRKKRRRWSPLRSFRFWTFGSACFGLTGTVLTGLELASPLTTVCVSSGLGFGIGSLAAWVVYALRHATGEGQMTRRELLGHTGTLLLPLQGARTSKVRIVHRGRETDLLAISDSDLELPKGSRVVVVQVDARGRAVVAPEDRLFHGEEE